MLKLAIAALVAMLVLGILFAWAVCAAGGRADDEMERMHRERTEDQ